MFELVASSAFQKWIGNLSDMQARDRIAARLARVETENFGDIKSVGAGIFELRIPYGPGYRVYLMQRGAKVVVLLCGGDKKTQRKDIARAKEIAQAFEDELWQPRTNPKAKR